MNKIARNSKIIFYVSKEKRLIGEGEVKSVSNMTPADAWSKYEARLFLNADEFDQYTSWSTIDNKARTSKKMSVFVKLGKTSKESYTL